MEWVLAGCFGLGGIMVAQSAWDWVDGIRKRNNRGPTWRYLRD